MDSRFAGMSWDIIRTYVRLVKIRLVEMGVMLVSIELLGAVSVEDAVLVVDELQAHVSHLSGSDASSQLARVGVLAAKLDAYRLSLISAIDSSEVWRAADPNGTPASFLRQEHVLDQRTARSDLRAAKSFVRFPDLERACVEGRISREKVDVMLGFGLRTAAREAALGEFLGIFIELAERVTSSDLKRALELWADQIDPVTTAGDESDAHQRRELHVHQLGDGVKLDGFFGREQGMKIMVALNAALQLHRRENPDSKNEAKAAHHASEHGNHRVANATAAARADAFIDAIIGPSLESGALPTCGGAAANICVTVPLERLQLPEGAANSSDVRARLVADTLRLASATLSAPNGPGETLISASKAQQLSCDATVQRVILSAVGKPLDIGRRTRVIPEQLRTALVIRDGGCVFPFCDKPPGWTEGHHVQHWSQGGPTSLDNLVLLCSKHHHQVHSEHIPITFDVHGMPTIELTYRLRR